MPINILLLREWDQKKPNANEFQMRNFNLLIKVLSSSSYQAWNTRKLTLPKNTMGQIPHPGLLHSKKTEFSAN